jgi:L-ascorbate metabolism protein UlaG (beta-lactamase superfamily)
MDDGSPDPATAYRSKRAIRLDGQWCDHAGMDANLVYLGHSTILAALPGMTVLTDPVIRPWIGPLRRTAQCPVPDRADLEADAIIVSHGHHDHLDLPSLRSLAGKSPIIVPAPLGRMVSRRGVTNVVEIRAGETIRVGKGTITAVPAYHSNMRMPFGPAADALGFVLAAGSLRVYFAGDTDLFPGMADLRPLNVALLPVWGWGPMLGAGHLNPERAAAAVELLSPSLAIPIHWGSYWPAGMSRVAPGRLHAPPLEFRDAVVRLGLATRVEILGPGQRTAIPG